MESRPIALDRRCDPPTGDAMNRLTRSSCLAACLIATVVFAEHVLAQPIKLGELNSYKTFPAFLDAYRKGMELAADQINAAGGLLGRQVQLVVRDDNGNPGDAVS